MYQVTKAVNPTKNLTKKMIKNTLPDFTTIINRAFKVKSAIWLIVTGLFFSPATFAHTHIGEDHPAMRSTAGLHFIENKGQWESEIRYKAEVPGGAMFLTPTGFVYNFVSQEDLHRIHDLTCGAESSGQADLSGETIRHHAYRVEFQGANNSTSFTPAKKYPVYHNYFIGNDPDKWAGQVGLFSEVIQHNIYEGIDLKVYSEHDLSVKYDLIVRPGSDPGKIALEFDGVNPVLTAEGNLLLKTTVNEVMEEAPYTYQKIEGKTVTVESAYKLENGVLKFVFPRGYNQAYPLVIDPNLVFATFSGGTSSTFYAHSTTYDKDGYTYTAALAYGTGWPTTTGAYLATYPGSNSAAINKYNPDGSGLVYSTYFGASGSGNPVPNALKVNDSNELYMAGSVVNAGMPTTAGAFQTTRNGGSDVYVVGFTEDGSALIASTFVGGSGIEASLIGNTNAYSGNTSQNNPLNPTNITFDQAGYVWITSSSGSADFPVTANAYQDSLAGSHDAVLFKMTRELDSVVYGTYIGGSSWDGGIGLEYNMNNNTIGLVGHTESSNFPTTTGAYHTTAPGSEDGFALLLDNSTYNLIASTYIGTNEDDVATRLAFDGGNNFYVAGRTEGNYPITSTSGSVPNGYVFIDKLSSDLSTSIASTRTGDADNSIVPAAMMVDNCNNILVATITNNSHQTGMPLTADAFETSPRGFYFAAFTNNFQDLFFGSYYGASSQTDHFHPGVSGIDPEGIIYQSVCYTGNGTSWPTTAGAWSPNKQNGTTNDNVTFKFDFEASGVKSRISLPALQNDSICIPGVVEFENNSTSPFPMDFTWDFGDGNTSTQTSPTHTYTNTGTYDVVLHAHSDSACITDSWDTLTITVLSTEIPDITVNDTTICDFNQAINLYLNIDNPSENNSVYWGPTTAIIGPNDTTSVTVNPFVSNVIYVIVRDSIPNICGYSVTDTILINKTFLDYMPYVDMRASCIGTSNGFAWMNTLDDDTLSYQFTWRSDTDTFTIATGDSLLNVPSGDYNVYIQASNGCDTTLYFTLPYEAYYADFITSDTIICEGDFIDFDNQSADHFDTYFWDFGDQGSSMQKHPQHIYNTGGAYEVMLAAQGQICSDTAYRTVIVDPPLQEGFEMTPDEICLGESVTLHPLTDSSSTRIGWQLGSDNFRWETDLSEVYQHAFDAPGTYYIELLRQSRACAEQTWTDSVIVYPLPVIDLGPDSALCLDGNPILLKNLQEQSADMSYAQWWNTGDSTESLSVTHPGVYTLSISSIPLGCTNTESVVVDKDCYVDIPNAFSPNGDGHNDYFFPRELLTEGVSSFRMQIFTRWGQTVFETTDLNGRGWDGKFNGQDQPIGVYIYTIDIGFSVGRQEQYTGNVTIIR